MWPSESQYIFRQARASDTCFPAREPFIAFVLMKSGRLQDCGALGDPDVIPVVHGIRAQSKSSGMGV